MSDDKCPTCNGKDPDCPWEKEPKPVTDMYYQGPAHKEPKPEAARECSVQLTCEGGIFECQKNDLTTAFEQMRKEKQDWEVCAARQFSEIGRLESEVERLEILNKANYDSFIWAAQERDELREVLEYYAHGNNDGGDWAARVLLGEIK